jgi:alpha-L-arabinofuranosidase
MTVTLTNPSVDVPIATRIRVAGGTRTVEGRGTVLTHADMRARNTFDKPDVVRPSQLAIRIDGANVLVDLPKHSVAALELRLS